MMSTSEKFDTPKPEQLKDYHSPVLTHYGLMSEQTQTAATSGVNDDSGAYPFSYSAS